LEQAKQRVANEKKKQNEKKQKAENDNIRTTTSISYRDNIMKHFPDCYSYDELNRILSVALQTRECKHDNISMKCSGKTAHWARRWYGASGTGGTALLCGPYEFTESGSKAFPPAVSCGNRS